MGNIRKWLDNPKRIYADGVALYASVRFNRNIMELLRRKETPANMKKLEYELGKFASSEEITLKRSVPKPPKTIAEVIDHTVKEEEKKQSIMFHDLPEELRPVLLEANQLFRECCMLKVQLNELTAGAEDESLAIQMQIDRNMKKNALCWKKIDYWTEHRSLPASTIGEFAKLTPEQKLRRQAQLYSSISKLKSRIKNYTQHLSITTSVPEKTKYSKALAKSQNNLINQEYDLTVITNLIEGVNG